MQKSSTKHEHTDSNNTLEGPHTVIKHVWTQPPASPFRTVSPKRHSVWGPEGFTCRTESPVILPWDADKTPDSGAERAAGTPNLGGGPFPVLPSVPSSSSCLLQRVSFPHPHPRQGWEWQAKVTKSSFGGAHVLGPEADGKGHGSQVGAVWLWRRQTCPMGGGRMPFPAGGQG